MKQMIEKVAQSDEASFPSLFKHMMD